MEKGLVIKSTGSWYTVKNGPNIIKCKIKGKFRIKGITTTNPVAVGDLVNYKIISKNNVGIITNIQERKNYIIRRASNLSREAHLIASNVEPYKKTNGIIYRVGNNKEEWEQAIEMVLANKIDIKRSKLKDDSMKCYDIKYEVSKLLGFIGRFK